MAGRDPAAEENKLPAVNLSGYFLFFFGLVLMENKGLAVECVDDGGPVVYSTGQQ